MISRCGMKVMGLVMGIGILSSAEVSGQNCTLLKQTFAVADTIKTDTSQLYTFRFSENQLNSLSNISALKEVIEGLGNLQKTLDQDHDSYRKGIYWQLDTKLAEKQLEALKKKCGDIPFMVYQREMDFYRRRFVPKKE